MMAVAGTTTPMETTSVAAAAAGRTTWLPHPRSPSGGSLEAAAGGVVAGVEASAPGLGLEVAGLGHIYTLSLF